MVIAESANIIEYLLEHFGGEQAGLLPKRWREGKEGQVSGESEEWLRYRYFMHYAEGSLMGLMMIVIVATSMFALHKAHQSSPSPDKEQTDPMRPKIGIKNSPVPFFIRPITNQISSKIQTSYLEPAFSNHFSFLEQQLQTSPNSGKFLCGEKLTGADILLSFPLIAAKGRAGLTAEKYPLLKAYVDDLEQEPGYLKASERIIEIEGKFEPVFKL